MRLVSCFLHLQESCCYFVLASTVLQNAKFLPFAAAERKESRDPGRVKLDWVLDRGCDAHRFRDDKGGLP